MDLREPKKKKRIRVQARPSLPISVDDNGEWRIYTAHLRTSGTCIVDPLEMEAVYSMGFFGKGSLSRSFPSFGKRRFGVPPIIRNRQWMRRQQWLQELENLNKDSGRNNFEIGTGNGKEFCEGDVVEPISETSVEPEKVTEKQEIERDEECPTDDCKVTEVPEEITEIKADDDPPAEFKEEKKTFNPIEETTEQKDKDTCVESMEDEKPVERSSSSKLRTPKSEERDESLSMEIVCEESSIEKRKLVDDDIANNKKRKNESPIARDESIDDNEVAGNLGDDEICEIVEKRRSIESITLFDDTGVLREEMSQKIGKRPKNNEDEESTIDEETNPFEVLVLPDTDSDTENYLKKVKPRIETDGFPINETLHLTFEETFFLMYGLGCLQLVHYDGSIFSISNAWNYFQQQDKFFIQKYAVYHYFRSKGWIVKSGIKFGGDFLLYKQGPPFYHASYIVVIEVMDADTLIRDDVKSLRRMTWKNLLGLERLSETIGKEILFAQILWPSSIGRNNSFIPIETLSELSVRELLWRRWNPKRKQDINLIDEEDSDSV